MKMSLLFIITMIFYYTKAQEMVNGFIKDKLTGKPIPYASIRLISKPHGTFSDSNGKFEIPSFLSTDSMIITSIGYLSTKAVLNNDRVIVMERQVPILDSIFVLKRRLLLRGIFGIRNVKSDFLWGHSGYGEEFAQKIFINKKPRQVAVIKEVVLRAKNFNPDKPVLLHIYTVDVSTGLPGEDLLSGQYFLTRKHFKGTSVTINIEKENLQISDDVIYVAFEWLGSTFTPNARKGNTILLMTSSIDNQLTYSRTQMSLSYGWFPALRLPNQNKPTNTIFSVKADIY